MRRHQPREAGPDTRNTSPRGRGEQGVPLPGDPHPEPSGPSPRSATANTHTHPRWQEPPRRLPQQPGRGAEGAISRGSPKPHCPLENKAQCPPLQVRGRLGRREAHGGHAPRAVAHGGGLPYAVPGRPPPAHPHATSLLPAPSLGSWSSPKFPGTSTHAGRSVYEAPHSPAGHPRERQLGSAGAPPTPPRAPPDLPRFPRKRALRLTPALRGDPRPQLTSRRWRRRRPSTGRARAARALRQVAVPIGLGARSRPGLQPGRDPPAAAS